MGQRPKGGLKASELSIVGLTPLYLFYGIGFELGTQF